MQGNETLSNGQSARWNMFMRPTRGLQEGVVQPAVPACTVSYANAMRAAACLTKMQSAEGAYLARSLSPTLAYSCPTTSGFDLEQNNFANISTNIPTNFRQNSSLGHHFLPREGLHNFTPTSTMVLKSSRALDAGLRSPRSKTLDLGFNYF